MQCLTELYLEHTQLVTNLLPEIKHVDLWTEQVSFLQTEHPFQAPAVFFKYRSNEMNDLGQKVQEINLQVDIYYYFETFYDTNRGAKKQSKALEFLNTISKINAVFHGHSGEYFDSMRRIGFTDVETGTANLLYLQRYECIMIDEAAKVLSIHQEVNDVAVSEAATATQVIAKGPSKPDVDFS